MNNDRINPEDLPEPSQDLLDVLYCESGSSDAHGLLWALARLAAQEDATHLDLRTMRFVNAVTDETMNASSVDDLINQRDTLLELLRRTLIAVCTRDGVPHEDDTSNFELALRLGIGHVFQLDDDPEDVPMLSSIIAESTHRHAEPTGDDPLYRVTWYGVDGSIAQTGLLFDREQARAVATAGAEAPDFWAWAADRPFSVDQMSGTLPVVRADAEIDDDLLASGARLADGHGEFTAWEAPPMAEDATPGPLPTGTCTAAEPPGRPAPR